MKEVTLEQLRKISSQLRTTMATVEMVHSQEEADHLTSVDQHGHVWSIGDKYYSGVLVPVDD